MPPNILVCVFCGALGAIFGSFCALLVIRLPEKRDFISAPSSCDFCGARIAACDLLPIVSFLTLRGRCRWCGARIAPVHIICEASLAALFAVCAAFYSAGPLLPSALAVIFVAFLSAVMDIKTRTIPNGPLLFLTAAGLIALAIRFFTGGGVLEGVFGLFSASLVLLSISVLSGGGVGGGDIKLMAACGLILGWKLILIALALGCVIGAALLLPSFLMGKLGGKQAVPFAPFLSSGVIIVTLLRPFLTWI